MSVQPLLSVLHAQNNGVHFLPPTGPDRRRTVDLVHAVLAQHTIQRNWNHQFTAASAAASGRTNPTSAAASLANDTMAHVVTLPTPDPTPDLLYHTLSEAFSIPEYYGYSMDTLHMFLTDLTWLQRKHHVLLVSVPEVRHQATGTQARLWDLLMRVGEFWRQKGRVFLVLVVVGKSALQMEVPRI